jgi:prepilin-type N-terminal cleavage/methylation domain-containing protein
MTRDKNKGFTLIEVMVASFVFLLIVGSTIGLLTSVIESQVASLREQKSISEVSYAIEYISRSLRMAKKDETGSCTGVPGQTYSVRSGSKEVVFLNYYGKCQMFSSSLLSDGSSRIYEGRSVDETSNNFSGPVDITSANIYVHHLAFVSAISGWPRIMINVKFGPSQEVSMHLQTSVSQR